MQSLHRLVDENGVALAVLEVGIDVDPNNATYTRAFLQVAATFAELEAETKRQNTCKGIEAAREQGKHISRAPFGFDVGSERAISPRTTTTRQRS